MLSIVGFVMLFLPNGGQCHHTTLSSGDNGVAGKFAKKNAKISANRLVWRESCDYVMTYGGQD